MRYLVRSISFITAVVFLSLSWNAALAAPKGTVTIAVPFDLVVDLFNSKDARGRLGISQVYSALTMPNVAGTDRDPYLAKSWMLGKKGKSIEINMDKRARFTNGDPVTCHDVKFSWQQWQTGRTPFRSVSRKIKEVQITDLVTITVNQSHFLDNCG